MAKEKKCRPEDVFREDVRSLLEKRIRKLGYKVATDIGILKDFMVSDKSRIIQFGFFKQDIVIYKDAIPIPKVEQIKLYKPSKAPAEIAEKIIIPKLIIEVKLGVNSHQIIAYSEIARDIKNIFPSTKYFLLVRYTTKEEDLRRHGRNFDGIFKLKDASHEDKKYEKGDLLKELKTDESISKKLNQFLEKAEEVLVQEGTQ